MQNATASNVMAHDNDAQLGPQSWRQDAEEEYTEIEQPKRMIRKYTGKVKEQFLVEAAIGYRCKGKIRRLMACL